MDDMERLLGVREWLRMHGDFSLEIDVWSTYGCWSFDLKRLGQVVRHSHGATFDRRLYAIEEYIAVLDPAFRPPPRHLIPISPNR